MVFSLCAINSYKCFCQNFEKLLSIYIEQSIDLARAKTQVDSSKLDLLAKEGENKLSLSASSTYLDDSSSNSPSTSSFFPTNIESLSQVISLNKSFAWGGTLSFQNEYNYSDSVSTYSGATSSKEFKQGLVYTQDLGANFFGKKYEIDLESKVIGVETQKKNLSYLKEVQAGKLFTYYLKVILNQAKSDLAIQALTRSQARLNLIGKRLKDGLSEKVDYIQSEMAYQGKKEALINAQMNYQSSLKDLSELLERNVEEAQISQYKILETVKFDNLNNQTNGHSKEIDLKKYQLASSENYLKSVKRTKIPSILLKSSWVNNNFANSFGDAFTDGLLGGENREIGISLSFTWNIDDRLTESAIAKAGIEKGLKEYEIRTIEKQLEIRKEKLIDESISLNNTLISVRKRIDLAKSLLEQNNRRYNLGRTDLDTVIRSEEELINSQKTFYELLTNQFLIQSSFYMLSGEFDAFVKKYQI